MTLFFLLLGLAVVLCGWLSFRYGREWRKNKILKQRCDELSSMVGSSAFTINSPPTNKKKTIKANFFQIDCGKD